MLNWNEMEKGETTEAKVLHIPKPIRCRIVERINRFVVKVDYQGNYHRAYINNTGRLEQFLVSGKTGFCIGKEKTGKTDCRLFAIMEGKLGAIIDTQLQMQAFEKSLESGLIPWLQGYRMLKRNARLSNSLIDYLLEGDGEEIYLEVKSAVLREGRYAMYPDCPSARGRRHVRELTRHALDGGKAIILFIAALPGISAFKPARLVDPELQQLLIEAHHAGVGIKSIGLVYQPADSFIYLSNPDVRVNL